MFRSERMPVSIDRYVYRREIPVGASKCAPVQHFINILGGVFLGPGYAVGMAFVTSLLRNLMGTGTLLAFPGSMCGAFLCGMLYKYGKHLPFAYAGELFGTSVIGGLLSYPIATLIMGSESAVFGFVIPFFVSSCGGTIIAAVLVTAMKKMKVFDIYLSRKSGCRNSENKALTKHICRKKKPVQRAPFAKTHCRAYRGDAASLLISGHSVHLPISCRILMRA